MKKSKTYSQIHRSFFSFKWIVKETNKPLHNWFVYILSKTLSLLMLNIDICKAVLCLLASSQISITDLELGHLSTNYFKNGTNHLWSERSELFKILTSAHQLGGRDEIVSSSVQNSTSYSTRKRSIDNKNIRMREKRTIEGRSLEKMRQIVNSDIIWERIKAKLTSYYKIFWDCAYISRRVITSSVYHFLSPMEYIFGKVHA